MDFKASCRYVKMSPRKARYVVDLIRGKTVNHALEALRLTNKRASFFVDKTLRAAIAGASENQSVDIDSLFVKEIYVDGGPARKWFRPRARGVSSMIKKRTSHISLVLSDGKK
ncbi:MAG: 50S ribosomal protein L22 [Candidatus Scalindua sp.]|jgi:large subunit ribosomal protein L22|nr:50S ribosomal protein L22 [Candidatus Scalindua sp.]MDV5166005.1 50S ribosomal protein L22 [Candidatus Scalindua sp.]